MAKTYTIDAHWDADSRRWWAADTELPGLVLEADSLDAFISALDDVAPDLLRANVFKGEIAEPVTLKVRAVRNLELAA